MEIAEIKDLLNKMNAFAEMADSLDSTALMQDPIVLNLPCGRAVATD